jgi:hypothetical protein
MDARDIAGAPVSSPCAAARDISTRELARCLSTKPRPRLPGSHVPWTKTVKRFSATLVLMLGLAARTAAQTGMAPPASPPDQSAPEPMFTWGAEVDTASRYLWHGLSFSDGAVVWPSAWVSGKGFTFELWGNVDHQYDPKFNEYDLSVGYERAIGKLTVSGTITRYTYREISGDPGSTSEAIVRAAYTIGPGEVFTTNSFDVETYVGAYYVDIGYAMERELTPKSLLEVEASVAFWPKFADKYDLPSDGPLGPATLNVALVQRLTAAVGVRPHVTFTRLLDRVARHELGTPGVTYGAAIVIGYW